MCVFAGRESAAQCERITKGPKSRRGTEVAALCYGLVESAKLTGLEPKAHLRLATQAALRGKRSPLPHEVTKGIGRPTGL